MSSTENLLTVSGLGVTIGGATVLDNISLAIRPGEALGLVGESGCGKSMTSLGILGLLPRGAKVTGGSVKLRGQELLGAGEEALQKIRGGDIGMIFQEPGACLDPVMRVGRQIGESLWLHRRLKGAAQDEAIRKLLIEVGLTDIERVVRAYPHELSGGMQQRAMIAMALAGEPVVLIADEPTTALDARIASQILDLLDRLRRERGLALLLISHDLAVIGGRCDRVMVMYAGRVVESATAEDIFRASKHPYTAALIDASPGIAGVAPKSALRDIPGQLPAPGTAVDGCAFASRCSLARPICSTRVPQWTVQAIASAQASRQAAGQDSTAGQGVRCLQYEEGW